MLDSALSVAASWPLCNINRKEATDLLNKYNAAIRYQQTLMEITKQTGLRKYDEALMINFRNDLLYRKNDLEHLGLAPYSLYDFIASLGDPLFAGHAMVFYANHDSLTEAFRYLKLMRSGGFPKKLTRDAQEVLGKKMAVLDYHVKPASDPDSLLKGYVPDPDWFSRFMSAYRRQWKQELTGSKVNTCY